VPPIEAAVSGEDPGATGQVVPTLGGSTVAATRQKTGHIVQAGGTTEARPCNMLGEEVDAGGEDAVSGGGTAAERE
jgi:hypothetical protein